MENQIEESNFKELLSESIINQYEKFEYYRRICKLKKISSDDLRKCIENEEYYVIPSVAASAFKLSKGLLNELNDLSLDGKFQVSSNTSGDPSYVYTSSNELTKIVRNYKQTFGVEGSSNAIAFSPSLKIMDAISKKLSKNGTNCVARMKLALDGVNLHYNNLKFTVDFDYLKFIQSLFVKDKQPVKNLELNEIIKLLKIAEQSNQNIVIGGVTLLLAPYLKKMVSDEFNFNDRINIIFSGGGYQGVKGTIKGESIDKPEFIKTLSSIFGINNNNLSTNIKDIYAFTECSATHLGYWSNEHNDFVFDTWLESKAYIVDPDTELPLKTGKGLLKFISPYANGNPSSSNVSVLQFDSAEIIEQTGDYQVTKFSNIMRSKSSGLEGCAYKAAEISKK